MISKFGTRMHSVSALSAPFLRKGEGETKRIVMQTVSLTDSGIICPSWLQGNAE
jgi:hypothetical protein